MTTYKAEFGHILGGIGQTIHHVANLLTITANHLTGGTDADEAHPEDDNYATVEQAETKVDMPEMLQGARGTQLEDDNGSYRLGFNNNHIR